MFTIRSHIFALLVVCACTPSAPPPPKPISGHPSEVIPTGVISGRITVAMADRPMRINEREPNNDFDGAQRVEPSVMRIEALGTLGPADPVDVYRVTLTEPVLATIILSFDSIAQEQDFGFSLYDGQHVLCAGPSGLDATHCVDSGHTPETGRFEFDHDFMLIVEAAVGAGPYELGLELTPLAVTPATTHFVPGEVLVKFTPRTPASTCRQLLNRCGFREAARGASGVWRATCAPHISRPLRTNMTHHGMRWLRRQNQVVFAEPNMLFYPATLPNDRFFENQWHYDLINLEEAWDITIGDEDVIVAVIDTGIVDHPDIAERIVDGFDFITEPATARDGDGIDDDPTDEGDLAGGPTLSTFHGLHIAGTVGATTDNDFGISGVTWATGIMPLRALGAGGGTSFDLSEAVAYAAGLKNVSGTVPKQRADIVNLSVAAPGGMAPSETLGASIRSAAAAGVIFVGAAGNDGTEQASFPAAYDDVIAVTACDPRLERASYSNYGSTIDITAPGGDLSLDINGDGFGDGILSLGVTQDTNVRDPILTLQQGTSMACPHVSGVIALMLAANPTLEPVEVRDILFDTAFDLGDPGRDDHFGAGLVDAAAAVAQAAERGGDGVADPRLSVSSASVDFGRSLGELTILLANAGTGMLEIEDITVVELVGSNWLEVVPGTGNEHTSVASLTVRVERGTLENGRYHGTITLTSSAGGSRVISIAMTVGRALELEESIFVVVIDDDTRTSVAQAETSLAREFDYLIRSLPAGTYQLYAGTDRDDDGLICDLGELCGALPSPIEATSITLSAGEHSQNVDFAVGELIFQSQATTAGPLQEGIPLAHFGTRE